MIPRAGSPHSCDVGAQGARFTQPGTGGITVNAPILVGYSPQTADRGPINFGVAASRFTGPHPKAVEGDTMIGLTTGRIA
jgi:hypothetical protein